ncbi:MAG TPA: hypothetical protein VFZ09_31025 [Archangium sp.]|uniref:hypothetical protein n=1 Tax=Archangium sp. TaxID=1872627 RepID=UPI002E34B2B6|nr:hypothetical protein [Archangium sp.]HEX5750701.1 hypothetical protein [Archangium sp.]
MYKAYRLRSLQALVVASCLWLSLSAAGGELRLEPVTLSVKQRAEVDAVQVVRAGVPVPGAWEAVVLPLRVVDSGRLRVEAGAQVVAACSLGFGEDELLRVEPLEADSHLPLPRVLHRERGREEVAVHIPVGAGDGQRLVLTYEWDWIHQGKPALVRTWQLPPSTRQERPTRGPVPPHFERNGKASLERALDTLEPLAASAPGHGLTVTVRELREDMRRAFFDVSRVHDARMLERALWLSQEVRRLWPAGAQGHPAAASALADLRQLMQQAAYVSLTDARLLFGASPPAAPEQAARVAAGTPAFHEAERAWEEAARHLEQGREEEAGEQWLRAWRKALEAMSGAGVHFRPGQVTDVDGDGVPDQVEVRYGASPLSADTDGDGLTDGFELRWGGVHLMPARADTDGDGTADGAEDVDGDGWTSLQEQARGTDPLEASPSTPRQTRAPRGGAGHPRKVLAQAGPGAGTGKGPPSGTAADPFDTDGDGLEDSAELANGTPPTLADWDGGTALSGWKPCRGSVPFFLGQLSGGAASFIPVVGWVVGALADVRDAVGNAVKGEWAGAGLSLVGVIPVVGDVGKLVGRIVEFTSQYGKLEDILRVVLLALPKLLGTVPERTGEAARELVLAVLKKVNPEGFSTVAKYGGDEFLTQVAKLGAKWKNLARLFDDLERSGLFTQYPRMKEFLEEMVRTTPAEVLYGKGQVLRLDGRVTLSVKKAALRPRNGPKSLANISKHLSSALAEHRSLSVLPGDGEDLIKLGHVASQGPDRVLRNGEFIDVLEWQQAGLFLGQGRTADCQATPGRPHVALSPVHLRAQDGANARNGGPVHEQFHTHSDPRP